MSRAKTLDSAARRIRETAADLDVPVLLNDDWAAAHPWLLQGVSWRGPAGDFDLGLFGEASVGETVDRWRRFRIALGFAGCVHARQVHGTRILTHHGRLDGLLIAEGADGHATGSAGLLLTVSVADCIPVALADPVHRRVAIVHAGWRGVAAGAVGAAVRAISAMGSYPADLIAHLGPAICGKCYEVGPEVHERLGLPRPATNQPIDLPGVARRRIIAAGIPADAVSRSAWCPRCEPARFFSHRTGAKGRQMGFIGIRPEPAD